MLDATFHFLASQFVSINAIQTQPLATFENFTHQVRQLRSCVQYTCLTMRRLWKDAESHRLTDVTIFELVESFNKGGQFVLLGVYWPKACAMELPNIRGYCECVLYSRCQKSFPKYRVNNRSVLTCMLKLCHV